MLRKTRQLQLELLESRVMLAAGDGPVTATSWETAIQGDEVHAELVSYGQYGEVLRVTGTGHGHLSIDLNALPERVITIQISSFESVVLVGEHALNVLSFTDVRRADAGKVSGVRGELSVFATGVDELKIAESPMWLQLGQESRQGGKTLLEIGHINKTSTISSFLDELGIMANSPVEEFTIGLAGNSGQRLLTNFQPQHFTLGGAESAQQASVLQGDFVRYFKASAAERVSLENSSIVARQVAFANLVPLATVVSRAFTHVVTSDTAELGLAGKLHEQRPLSVLPPTADLVVEFESAEMSAMSAFTTVSDKLQHSHVDLQSFLSAPAATGDAPAPKESLRPVAFDFSGTTSFLASQSSVPAEPPPAVGGAMVLALAQFTESFGQTILDLQGRATTFGQIVSAEISTNLRAESRPALLVNVRSARERDDKELAVFSV